MNSKDPNQEIIEHIVEIELGMFQSVNSTVHSPCQDHLKTFQVMRKMHYSVLPKEILESYLSDVQLAKDAGRNLMTEKYARMEDRIPPLNSSELIPQIVALEAQWMAQLRSRYPRMFQGSGEMFEIYARCELETLSARTLRYLFDFMRLAHQDGRNLVKERYEKLVRSFGYASLEEKENSID